MSFLMPNYQKTRELADQFDEVYPGDLAERIAWWCDVVGISRQRMLRMMGLSSEESATEEKTSWSELFNKNKDWEENAWLIEGKLVNLLTFFDYDWKSLSDQLHPKDNGTRENGSFKETDRGGLLNLTRNVPISHGAESFLYQLAHGESE